MKKLFFSNFRFTELTRVLLVVVCLSSVTLGATFTVTKIADTSDGACDADCSLREAVSSANSTATNDEINFAAVFSQARTIPLGSGDLQMTGNGNLIMNGTGADTQTLHGGESQRK